MSRCKQCHTDGHHKMSCTDESNPTRKGRVTMSATRKEPIVEGAWYQTRNHLDLPGLVHQVKFEHGREYHSDGSVTYFGQMWMYKLTHRVYPVPTDPAEVVAELRRKHQEAQRSLSGFPTSEYFTGLRDGHEIAADLVAKKLGVK